MGCIGVPWNNPPKTYSPSEGGGPSLASVTLCLRPLNSVPTSTFYNILSSLETCQTCQNWRNESPEQKSREREILSGFKPITFYIFILLVLQYRFTFSILDYSPQFATTTSPANHHPVETIAS